jgi:hypothetical protein
MARQGARQAGSPTCIGIGDHDHERGKEPDMPDDKQLDALDLQRLGLLTLAVLDLSTDQDVRIRRSKKGVWRVDVMYKNFRQTTHSSDTLLAAMDLTLERLRRMTQPLGEANVRLRGGYITGALVGALLLWSTWGHAASWTCVPPLGQVPAGQTAQCTTTFDSTTLPDGPHTIKVIATDAAGNTATDSVVVTVDNTPPVLVVISPVPQGTYKGSGVIPSGSAIDVTTAVQSVSAVLDGVPMPVTRNGAAWSMAPITKKGGHTLVMSARDGAGNVRSQTVTFKIVGGK